MSVLPIVTKAPPVKTSNIITISRLYSVILIIFAVTQLFSFPDFQVLIQSYWLPGGTPSAYLLSGVIVIAEVFALPFLLRMRVSNLFRIVSMVLGWIVPVIWLGISLWLLLSVNAVTNIGFLGTVFVLTPGWWAVFVSLALATLAAWASWGMWPLGHTHKK
ncbi:MAG: rane protein of unknown function [Candidatus Saccharibacteria bacterium]|nr:rane protein of unknown function [Candidatus Saccharibacteria bacterium]